MDHIVWTRLKWPLCVVLTLLSGCGAEVIGEDPPKGALYTPVGMALHPEGRYLYVVNSNFEVTFREDRGGTVVTIDTDTLETIPEATVQIGTFGGEIALNTAPEGPTRAYVAVRGDESVVALDVEPEGRGLNCGGSSDGLACRIDTERPDPFGVAAATLEVDIDGQPTPVDFVAVAHLLGGDVTGLSVRGAQSVRSTTAGRVSRSSTSLIAGANGIARSPRSGQFYVTSRFENAVVAFRPVIGPEGELAGVFETALVPINSAPPLQGLDSRGIAFNGTGTMAYIANRGPSSLLFLDTGPTDTETGSGTVNEIVDTLLMPIGPAEIAVVDFGDRELLYVSSFNDETLTIVDPKTRAIVGSIEMLAQPYDLIVDQARHQRLYVSLFSSDAVAVIDIDPDSPSFNQTIAVIR